MKQNEQIYKLLFESAAEGLVVVNRKGNIQLVNPTISKMFGYTEVELVGQPVEILLPEALKKGHEKHRDGYMSDPHTRSMGANMNLQASKKDGSQFYVEVGLNHLKIDNETFVMALISDITERAKMTNELEQLNEELEKRVERRTEQLDSSQKLYRLIASNFPNGSINVFDRELRYVFAEGKELRKLGLVGQQLIGTRYIDRLHPSIAEGVEKKLNMVLAGQSTSFEIEYKNNFYVINAVPLRGSKEKIEQILVIEKNISENKKNEQQMKEMLEKERHLNELKSRFVSMASHEFRTPLTTILSSTTLAERYTEADQQDKREKHFKRIKTSVSTLTSILNDFLSLDKLEQGVIDVNLTEFNFSELIEEIVEEITSGLKTGQELIKQIKIDSPEIVSDRNVIKNIMNNLLSNASKYSTEGKPIELTIEKGNNNLLIKVKDHGIGIPKAEQEQLFGRFFRAKNVTNIQGTGLGLNIVKKYVELLNGDISFESEEEKGTTFIVNLPVK